MRKNLGKALAEAADLYERTAVYCLNLEASDMPESLRKSIERQKQRLTESRIQSNIQDDNDNDADQRTVHSITRGMSNMEMGLNQEIEIWNHELINEVCDKAFDILAKLQTEATRLRTVSKEYYLQAPLHFLCGGGRARTRKDLRRTKEYGRAIGATKSIIWPVVSFRLLLPLVRSSQIHKKDDTAHDRCVPTRATLENFEQGLTIMRQLADMLSNTKQRMSQQADWNDLRQRVSDGNLQVQSELSQAIRIGMISPSVDGLNLLSYYGFLVRLSQIWQGLCTIVTEVGPHDHSSEHNQEQVIIPVPDELSAHRHPLG